MKDKIKIGGSALKGGLSLQSDNYYVAAEFVGLDKKDHTPNYDGPIQLTEKKIGKEWKIVKILAAVPFLRGILMPLLLLIQKFLTKELSLLQLVINILFYACIIYGLVSGGSAPGITWLNFLMVSPLVVIILICIFAHKVPVIREIFKFHGAEHIMVRAHEEGIPFNSNEIKNLETFHPRCGSNYVAIMFVALLVFCFTLIYWIPLLWGILIAQAVALEIFSLANTFKSLQRPLSIFGIWFQKTTVLRPDDKHLQVGSLVITKLLQLEESKEDFTERKRTFNNIQKALEEINV